MAKAEYRSAIRSRRLIQEAFADLLQEKPPEKITVTDVVQRAGINRGTFYAHYANIPDVIDHFIDDAFCRIRQTVFSHPLPPVEIPGALLRGVQTTLEQEPELYRKLMCSGASSILREKLVALVLEQMLLHEKEFELTDHEQYVFLLCFCAGGLSSLYADWFAGKLNITLPQLTAQAEELVRGIITRSSNTPITSAPKNF